MSAQPASSSHASKLAKLRQILRDMQSVLVCYSGGIDSALVLAVAHEQLGTRAIGLTAVSPSLPASERDGATRTAQAIGARHHFVSSRELERPGYVQNGPDRCFHCKSELYSIAEQKLRDWELSEMVNGANLDDLGDYRPGLEAAREARVRSPLIEAGFSKVDVRSAARELGLEIWDKPAAACLSSRIPYGSHVTEERLAQIGGFEAALRALGFQHVRVRWHETIARIEVDVAELPKLIESGVREQIVASGKRFGFAYVTLDLAGYRQGSHNELLGGKALRVIS